jgi:hypothetical protein
MAPVCHAVCNKFANFEPGKNRVEDVLRLLNPRIPRVLCKFFTQQRRLPRHDWPAVGSTPDGFGRCQWRGFLQIAGVRSMALYFALRSSVEQVVIGCKIDIFLHKTWHVGLDNGCGV